MSTHRNSRNSKPNREEILSVLDMDREIIRRRQLNESITAEHIEELSSVYGTSIRPSVQCGNPVESAAGGGVHRRSSYGVVDRVSIVGNIPGSQAGGMVGGGGMGGGGVANAAAAVQFMDESDEEKSHGNYGTNGTEGNGMNGSSRSRNGNGTSRSSIMKHLDSFKHPTYEEDPITLTESTHTFLFTEPTCSLPFAFALVIAGMSYACLVLALFNNMEGREEGNWLNVPVSVSGPVRGAQYLAMIIGLLMEEEIPTGLFLLRNISPHLLHQKLPHTPYYKFAFSSLIRITMGYIFLINMFLVVVQATGVLDIFYDVLALQFVQQLDDIAFSLSHMDVFGKRMKRATIRKCFKVEFEKEESVGSQRKRSIFLKVLYFFNLTMLIGGLSAIAYKQDRGDYHCDSMTVTFGDDIWDNAIVVRTDDKTGEVTEQRGVLLFSYFNGVYVRNGTFDGRPVYVEMNKFDNQPFETREPARIKYCKKEESWVFSHEHIKKSGTPDDDCSWLLKSQETDEFNLLEVPGDWVIWTGTINRGAHMSTVCDKCQERAECNYHGQCVDGACVCDEDGYFGNHCQHERPCRTLQGDSNGTWSMREFGNGEFFNVYGRPVYRYMGDGPSGALEEGAALFLLYSGSRWFGTRYHDAANLTIDYWVTYAREFHSFWEQTYSERTSYTSDPTEASTPLGVDFYQIGSRAKKHGPFGELIPLRFPPGSGYFGCIDEESSYY